MHFIDDWDIWESTQVFPLPEALEKFTLHDSGMLHIVQLPVGMLFVSIDFDIIWNQAVPKEFSLLVIRFACPYRYVWREGSFELNTLGDATSSVVPEEDRIRMLDDSDFDLRAYQGDSDDIQAPWDDEGLTLTTFRYVNWGRFEVLHGLDTRIRCFSPNGDSIDLSAIDLTGL